MIGKWGLCWLSSKTGRMGPPAAGFTLSRCAASMPAALCLHTAAGAAVAIQQRCSRHAHIPCPHAPGVWTAGSRVWCSSAPGPHRPSGPAREQGQSKAWDVTGGGGVAECGRHARRLRPRNALGCGGTRPATLGAAIPPPGNPCRRRSRLPHPQKLLDRPLNAQAGAPSCQRSLNMPQGVTC